MKFYIPAYYRNQLIVLPLMTKGQQRMYINVSHVSKPYTVYFNSTPLIKNNAVYNIKIPKIPQEGVMVEIFNEMNGNVLYYNGQIIQDNTFALGPIDIKKLVIPIQAIADESASRFAKFCDDFCEDAGVIPAMNRVYISRDRQFRIDYKEVIRDDDPESKMYGQELTTPARVNELTKIIEVSKKHFKNFTVPGRKAILWHEWGHVYKNADPSNEFEADKNALFMYLGTGNPKLEASRVFLKTFINTPPNMDSSNLNVARYNKIRDYIDNYNDKLN